MGIREQLEDGLDAEDIVLQSMNRRRDDAYHQLLGIESRISHLEEALLECIKIDLYSAETVIREEELQGLLSKRIELLAFLKLIESWRP
tara:strand:- start:133 stop:399 length:267 start_codon:yes stop_codon:yes gene_type:complete